MQYEKIEDFKIIESLGPNLSAGQFVNSFPSYGIISDREFKQNDNNS